MAADNPSPIKIVASFSILGDMIQQIGGDVVDLSVLVGAEEDAHGFQPSPQDAQKLAAAEIIAINGLKFEGWIGRLIKASGTKAKLLVASAGVKPRLMEEENHHAHEPEDTIVDPHAWQDLKNGEIYAKNIASALIDARPTHAEKIKKRARAYIAKIKELDAKIKKDFAGLPDSKRIIITSHDAFGYFGRAYGITFLAPLGLSTESEPSAAAIVQLIEQIKTEKVKALFLENMTNPHLIEQIAKDTDAHIGGTLYVDALSAPDGPAPTYLDMFRHNAKVMGEGMGR